MTGLGYLVIVEKGKSNYSAFLPDVPGCVSTGKTWNDVKNNMLEALAFHIEGLREEELPVPIPQYEEPIFMELLTGSEEQSSYTTRPEEPTNCPS